MITWKYIEMNVRNEWMLSEMNVIFNDALISDTKKTCKNNWKM